MMRILSLLACCLPLWSWAQIEFQTTSHDFGELGAHAERFVDLPLINNGEKSIYILRAGTDREWIIKFSNKKLEPGKEEFIRIQYQPMKLGSFKKTIPLYLSDRAEPITLTIKGKITSLAGADSPCPDFSQTQQARLPELTLELKVIDAQSKKPIEKAQVLLLRNGFEQDRNFTDRNGTTTPKIPLGLYYVVTSAKNYETSELAAFFNPSERRLIVELVRLEPEEIPVEELPPPVVAQEPDPEPKPAPTPVPDSEPEPVEVVLNPDSLPFTLDHFAPNNVVFLIDASYSMRKEGRMDLLKASMIELLELLRPEDRLCIVTYASQSKVVLPSVHPLNKDSIVRVIQSLQAGGNTAGDQGMLTAFEQAKSNFIPNGNNQIIVATDGKFTVSKQRGGVAHTLKTNESSGIAVSVVGIKNTRPTEESMQQVAKLGQGHYLKIHSYEHAQAVLVQEIRNNSFRR
ncbi:MAG: VWA domain-containing protein [Salibacteraceae bacterium]